MNSKDGPVERTGMEIAVIGMAGRFPGAANIDEFWDNLINGRESIAFAHDEELASTGYPRELIDNPHFVRAGNLINDKEYFDPAFFGYSPNEAVVMDPQLRLFHEVSWEALEDAGYEPGGCKGAVGVYGGSMNSFEWQALSLLSGAGSVLGSFAKSLLYNCDLMCHRISHRLNLRGPSITLFTACSTSLVALHLACRALIMGECGMALAGGVTASKYPAAGYLYEEGLIQSTDGHCRAFDARANGTILGEGIGIVVLKRVQDAINDEDHIYALVKSSSINNDGLNKVEFTAPSVKGQADVIRTAQKLARVTPRSIGYIEAHGTATRLGDPIEISALKKAFSTEERGFCGIGTIKSNIGHLDTASGIAGFIKTVLALKHRLIPPSLHFETPNPEIDFANSPFYVVTRLTPWERGKYPLRAGVSSFGFGGTNAHVILEEFPGGTRGVAPLSIKEMPGQDRGVLSPPLKSREYQLISLSAKTQTALDKMTENLAEYLKKNFLDRGNPGNPTNPTPPGPTLADAAYTLQVGRKAFKYRRMAVCRDIQQAVSILSSLNPGSIHAYLAKSDEDIKVIFMFPGQGSQYVNMGRELYETEPVFREEMDRCFKILKPLLGYDIKEIIYPSAPSAPSDILIDQTEVAQPVIFTIEYALAQSLIKWGIEPEFMIGHSIGEYTAAHLAGVFSLEDALKLVVLRARAMQQLPGGAMVSVTAAEEELVPLLEQNPGLSLAAVNAPRFSVISGPHQAIAAIIPQLEERGYETRRLHTSHAFHSGMMDPILNEFAHQVSQVELNKPVITIMSNVTGKPLTPEQAVDPGYWAAHLRSCVRFSDAIEELYPAEDRVFLEIGPGKTLTAFVNQHKDKLVGPGVLNLVRHPQEEIDDVFYLLNKIGHLWLLGKNIHWPRFYGEAKPRRISMPTYPFQRKKYWFDTSRFAFHRVDGNSWRREPDMADWFYAPSWERCHPPANPSPPSPHGLNWLVLEDPCGVARRVGNRLHQENSAHHIIYVKTGETFAKIPGQGYQINPAQAEDYKLLFEELRRTNRVPHQVLHSWNVIDNTDREPGLMGYEKSQDLGIYSLLTIAQELGRQQITQDIQILVVSNNMLDVLGEEELSPEKSTLLGAVKIIPLEYTNIKCRSIDILLPSPASPLNPGMDRLAEQLVEELRWDTGEISSAIRGNHRWVQRYKPLHLEKPGADNSCSQRVKPGGVYLITGGLGGIGFTLAEHLTRTYKARLILTGRSPFPPRSQWGHWLAVHEKDDELSLKIRKVQDLEKCGAEIMIASADVAQYQPMKTVIHQAKERFGPIQGVIHAAGVIDYAGTIQQRTRAMTEESMAARVKGTLVLEDLLKDEPLDFFVLFSFIGNVLYKDYFGQVGFISANEFLESFALYKARKNKTFAVTINWADWLEQGTAMKTNLNRHKDSSSPQEKIEADIKDLVNIALSPAEGLEIFNRILCYSYSRVLISPLHLDDRIRHMNRREAREPDTARNAAVPDGETYYDRPELTIPYTAPGNEIEEKMTDIFREFFAIHQVGIHDDFFELGGNSLVAMGLIDVIHKQLAVKIPLAVLFSNPTISKLSRYIANAGNTYYSMIKPREEKDYYPLSSAQRRLFIVQQLNLENTVYNVARVLVLPGDVSIEKLEEVFKNLMNRQQGLQTSFEVVKGEPVQRIHKNIGFKIPWHRVNTAAEAGVEAAHYFRPFDLSLAPMLRVGLIKIGRENPIHILVMVTHHIVCDGFSEHVITREYKALYQGKKLPSLKLQYKDFSEWQNSLEYREIIKPQENYWLSEFSGEIPLVNLPTDYERPPVQSFEGDMLYFPLGKELSDRLYRFAREKEFTLFMVLLTGYYILLFKYTLQQDIIVGSPITGRKYVDLQNLIGMFVNMLCLRGHPRGEKTIKALLAETKEENLAALENQDYQFEELTQRLGMQGELVRNPLFNTVFEMQRVDTGINQDNHFQENLHNPSPDQSEDISYDLHAPIQSPFDLILSTLERGSEIVIRFTYSTKLFKRSTVENLARHYTDILNHLVKDETLQLKDITFSHRLLKVESRSYNSENDDFVFQN